MLRAVAVAAALIVLVLAATALTQRIGQVEVYGTVLDWRGRPVAGATVEVYQGGALVAKASSSGNGVFDLWLDPGVYTFKVYAAGLAPREETLRVPGGRGAYSAGRFTLDPAVQLVAPATGFTVEVGGSYSLPVSLANRGLYWETVSIAVHAPPGWQVGLYSGDVKVTRVLLPPGASRSYELRVKVPLNASGAVNASLDLVFSRRYTVELSFKVGEPEGPIVVVEPSQVAASPGSLVEARVTVRNPYAWRAPFTVEVDAPKGWPAKLLDSEGRVVVGGVLEPHGSFEARLEVVPRGSGAVGVRACVAGMCGSSGLMVEARREMDVLVFSEGFVAASCRPGREAKFRLELANLGVTGTLVRFAVRGLPENYTWRLVDGEGNVFRELYVKPGAKTVFYLEVRPPLGEQAKNIEFSLEARGSASAANATLSLNVLNRVELHVATENFYVEARPGGEAVFHYTVENRGDAAVHSLRLEASDAPQGWRVTVEPSSIAFLPAGGNATFTVRVLVPGDARVGDYYLKLTLEWPSGSDERLLHVAVAQSGGAALTGWLLVAAVIVAVALIYLRYGRR